MSHAQARPLGILHVVVPTDVGGMQRVVQDLVTGLHQRRHRVALAGILPGGDPGRVPTLEQVEAAGVRALRVPVRGRGYVGERRAIHGLCREFRPDVVHTHGYRPDVLDAAVARSLGIPVVTTVHGFTGGDWKNRVYERLQIRALRGFDAVVSVSRPLEERLLQARVPRERLHLIRNAWSARGAGAGREDARRALGGPPAGPWIGWIGRFSVEKAPDVLVEAVPALADLGAHTVMIGDGPLLEAARRRAADLGAAVQFPGAVPEAANFMAAFDVLVLSSRSEGTPIVLFEAMAAGIPVVATAVGGVPDVVGPSEALLVDSEDAAALASAIRSSLADAAQAKARARSARARLDAEFHRDPWLERYERVYAEVLAGPRSR